MSLDGVKRCACIVVVRVAAAVVCVGVGLCESVQQVLVVGCRCVRVYVRKRVGVGGWVEYECSVRRKKK